MLTNSRSFRTVAFNAYAAVTFPELLREAVPGFLENPGGSLWIEKLA